MHKINLKLPNKIFIISLILGSTLKSEKYELTKFVGAEEITKVMKLKDLDPQNKVEDLTIAILDVGFSGFKTKRLETTDLEKDPLEGTELIESYDSDFIKTNNLRVDSKGEPIPGNQLTESSHGYYLGLLIKAFIKPKLLFLNAHGTTQLRRAVKYAIQRKVNIILYANNWEWGGNFDGTGFINKLVQEATANGITWINSTGNYGRHTYNGPIKVQAKDGFVEVPGKNNCLNFTNNYSKNELNITLSWNDFTDDEDYKTSKDLDLALYDSSNKLIYEATRRQVEEKVEGSRAQSPKSGHAREILTLVDSEDSKKIYLAKGDYCLRVKAITNNFGAKDHMRVYITGASNLPPDSINFIDHTQGQELATPADEATAIVVGANHWSSSKGPTLDGRTKPDILMNLFEAKFNDGYHEKGSTQAAGYATVVAALLKANDPKITGEQLIKKIQNVVKVLPEPPSEEADEQLSKDIPIGLDGSLITEVKMQGERKVIYVRVHPIELKSPKGVYLFEAALREELDARNKGEAESFDRNSYRYYIASQRSENIAEEKTLPLPTFYTLTHDPLPLPEDVTKDGAPHRWIELRKAVR